MRPTRFQAFLLDLAKNTPGVTRVQSLAEAGGTKYPFGLAVATGSGEARWQIVGQLAPGEKHEQPDVPVNGEPFRAAAEAEADDPEGWLAAVLGRAECPEIASIERWSTRPGGKPGLTVVFHDGARAFVRKI